MSARFSWQKKTGGNSKQRRRVGPRWLEAAKLTGAERAGTGTGAAYMALLQRR